ncbi:MAG: hypothetical protein IBX57_01745 [Gammaproteobacteria bacterium]|nr:hypothetical protein [Gammaproteobacteria bacterium]
MLKITLSLESYHDKTADKFSVGDSSRISLWQQVIHRMDVEAADERAMICLYQYYDLPTSVAKTKCS